MNNTGRIKETLTPTARRILFDDTADKSIDAELLPATMVDCAHLLGLAENHLVERLRAARVLQEISNLRLSAFAPLRGQTARRGWFLLYEDYLIEKLGAQTGGILQTARSRNDLNATVLRLRLREPYLRLLNEALRLEAVLLRRAERTATIVMPAYTHYQAAVPVTYGHYLAGVAQAISRDIAAIFFAGRELVVCPLGAGAVGGTTLPLDTDKAARRLGFERASANSFDAVASRDLPLCLLSAAANFGVTLSRLAADMLLWSTAEFGFLSFPDRLVGSSSMMPQKRNPFLLEHVQGRSTSVLGAFVSAASAMHAKPFTNSIAAGGEAAAHLWPALQSITEATTLARLVVAGAKPEPEAMLQRAEAGYTGATELANRFAEGGHVSFRTAHNQVGSIICEAIESGGKTLLEAALHSHGENGVSLNGLDPQSIVKAANYGGGPGPESHQSCVDQLRADWSHKRATRALQARKWRTAEVSLQAAADQFCRSVLKQ